MTHADDLQEAADLMWRSLELADPEKRAPLMAQWRALKSDLAALSDVKVGDQVDEIAERRAARGAGPASSPGRARPRSG